MSIGDYFSNEEEPYWAGVCRSDGKRNYVLPDELSKEEQSALVPIPDEENPIV